MSNPTQESNSKWPLLYLFERSPNALKPESYGIRSLMLVRLEGALWWWVVAALSCYSSLGRLLLIFFLVLAVWLITALDEDVLVQLRLLATVSLSQTCLILESLFEVLEDVVKSAISEDCILPTFINPSPVGPCSVLAAILE
jgi:hypothetical protein